MKTRMLVPMVIYALANRGTSGNSSKSVTSTLQTLQLSVI